MLSSIGRAAVKRLVSTTTTTSLRRIAVPCFAVNAPKSNHAFIRSFATPGRPKGSAKRTTAKKPAKKPVVKQTKSDKSNKSNTSNKSKTTPEPKTRKFSRKQKPLSPEKQAILEKRELKKTALFTEPKGLPNTPWTVFVAEETKDKSTSAATLRTRMPQLAETYRNLPASELHRMTAVGEQNKATYAAAYKEWVESHTTTEIRAAMKARQLLKRKYNYPVRSLKPIHDDRIPKQPLNAFSLFTKARWASGDHAHLASVPAAAKEIAKEWKNLPETERQAYADLSKANTEQYKKEVEAAF
ncbi:hypothetical protein GGR53DRAFT_512577 [Hypoxylon sp. FL1150]|nr:hypothetical protein GGR53DRAFT_512577 [Hypoxylon sp. FL1150]